MPYYMWTLIHDVDSSAHPPVKCNPINNQINSNWNAYKWQGINIFYVGQNVKKILFLPYDTTFFICIIDVNFLLQNKEVLRKYIKSLQHILRIPHTITHMCVPVWDTHIQWTNTFAHRQITRNMWKSFLLHPTQWKSTCESLEKVGLLCCKIKYTQV